MKVKTGIYVDEALRYRWERAFGGYASLSWLLETAIEGVLEGAERDESFTETVKAKIRDHVANINRAKSTQAKSNVTTAPSAPVPAPVLDDHRQAD
jgi:hypothetical protein